MKKIIGITLIGFVSIMLAACGGSSSGGGSGSSSLSIKSIADLPDANGPMAESASASIVKSLHPKAATIGLPFDSDDPADMFDRSSSRAACESYNVVRDMFRSASEADMIKCYVATYDTEASFSDITGVDPFDGEEHIFDLNITGTEDSPDRVKMTILEDANGNLEGITMYACVGDQQNQYLHMEIDMENEDLEYSMVAKGIYGDGLSSGGHSVSVTGNLDDTGAFLEKSIISEYIYAELDGSNTGFTGGTLTQTPGAFEILGYNKGAYDNEYGEGTWENSVFAIGEILNDTLEISSWAMGDGAGKEDSAYTWTGGSEDTDVGIEAWSGDSTAVIASEESDFYEDALAAVLLAVPASAPFAYDDEDFFSGDEVWDCGGTADAELPEVDNSIFDECEVLNDDWVDCWEIIESEE